MCVFCVDVFVFCRYHGGWGREEMEGNETVRAVCMCVYVCECVLFCRYHGLETFGTARRLECGLYIYILGLVSPCLFMHDTICVLFVIEQYRMIPYRTEGAKATSFGG